MESMSESAATETPANHPSEYHGNGVAQKLNWLRAGVLGANDGIVSVAATVVGVAGATTSSSAILIAGTAALVGGAVSMALGEYVSVSSSSDSEKAMIAKELKELEEMPEQELEELASFYEARGVSKETAHQVAVELTAFDALGAHLAAELNISEHDVVSPWHAAYASAIAFFLGASLPLATIVFAPADMRVQLTFIVVMFALALTGSVAAAIGGSSKLRATIRVVVGGGLALAVTYGIGMLLGVSGVV